MSVPRGVVSRRMDEAVTEFLDWRRSVRSQAASTVRSSEYILRRMAKAMRNPMVYNLTRNDVNRYVVQRGQRLSPATVNIERAHVRKFLTWCEEERYLPPGLNLGRDLVYARLIRRDRRRLTADMFPALYDTATCTRDRVLLVALTDTLCRQSEAITIQWGHVGLATGELAITRWKTRQPAVLPISSPLDRELRRYWIWYESKIGRPVCPEDYVFPRLRVAVGPGTTKTDDSIRLYPDTPMGHVHNIVKQALSAVGFGDVHREGGHTLRRSAARELLEAFFNNPDLGGDEALLIVMNMLGHASIDMTMRYIGYDRDQQKAFDLLKGKDWWAHTRPAQVVSIRPASTEG